MVSKIWGRRLKFTFLLSTVSIPLFVLSAQAQSTEELKKRLPMLPDVDGRSLSSLELGCRTSGSELPGYYACENQNGKEGFKSRVEKNVQNMLGSLVDNLYHGIAPDFVGGNNKLAPTPVCNLYQSEDDKNYLGKSCGDFCHLVVDKGAFSGTLHVDDKNGACDREYGWMRGAKIQAYYYSYEKVMQSFKSGRYELTSIDGVRPNGELAADIVRVQTVHKGVLDELIAMKGEGKVAALVCDNREIASANSAANKFSADPASHGACRLKYGGVQLINMWSRMLVSEIQWKTASYMEDIIGQDQDKFMERIKNTVGKVCEKEADCGALCSESEINKRLNTCYRREVKKEIDKMFSTFRSAPKVSKKGNEI